MELTVSHFKAKCLAIVEDIANKKEVLRHFQWEKRKNIG
jgi:hypothetical protein